MYSLTCTDKKYVDQGCLEDSELLQLLNASPGAEDEKEEEIEVQIGMIKLPTEYTN